MNKVSAIIPCRNEPYLARTVDGLLANAAGDVEVVITLDGPHGHAMPKEDKRVTIIQFDQPRGRRQATNAAVQASKGKFLMKMDAHILMSAGWDETLKRDCADNWIVVPTMYTLNANTWERMEPKPKPVSATRYLYPYLNQYKPKLACRPWPERAEQRKHILLDEDMGCDGSLYFMHRTHWDRLGDMEDYGYGTFVGEPEEVCLKTQLGPWEGKVMRNKNVWYAHWSKFISGFWKRTDEGVGWLTHDEWVDGFAHVVDYWWHNRWGERTHDIQWLIEKFWPIPGWPSDWRTKDTDTVRLMYGNRHT